jgi:hypothetical protein
MTFIHIMKIKCLTAYPEYHVCPTGDFLMVMLEQPEADS